jgi:hypothetical protein
MLLIEEMSVGYCSWCLVGAQGGLALIYRSKAPFFEKFSIILPTRQFTQSSELISQTASERFHRPRSMRRAAGPSSPWAPSLRLVALARSARGQL